MKGITGKDYIEESLRQRCIYEIISKDKAHNQNFTLWFNYALRFIDECSHSHQFKRNCSDRVLDSLKINKVDVQKCYTK